MRLREVTHHGSFFDARTIEVPELTPEAMVQIAAECPYRYALRTDVAADLVATLEAGNTAERGWTRWTPVHTPTEEKP